MIIWVDAQLSPTIARWITEALRVEAKPVRELGLREAPAPAVLAAARLAGAVIMGKTVISSSFNGRDAARFPSSC